jgi:type I restriction enzyme S subunit
MRWATVELGEVCVFLSGFAFKSDLFSAEPNGLPVIRIRDVLPGSSKTFYSGDYQSQYIVERGDILIGMDGEFNRERWKSDPALLNQRVCKAIARSNILDDGYLYHALPMLLKKIEDETPFVTVKHLSVAKLKSAQIPIPPLEEQRRIAAILDRVSFLLMRSDNACTLVDKLQESIFIHSFGEFGEAAARYPTLKLEDVCSLITDGEHQTPLRSDSGVKLLSARNIRNGKLDFSDVDFVPMEEFARIGRRCAPVRGDVLISCSGSIGRVAVVDTDEPLAMVRSAAMARPWLTDTSPRPLATERVSVHWVGREP